MVSGQEPRWTFHFELPLLSVFLLLILTEIMPKESVTSLKQQNQDLKDKVDALSKEITQLKEKVRVDSAITFGAEAAATSGNSINNASNDETVSRSLQYLSDEYDDLSASNSGVVDQLKALSRRLNKLSAEVTRVGNAIDEVEEYSYQFNVKIIGLPEKSSETAAETSALCVKLFQEMGAEVFLSDIDIAHRVPSRQQNGAPKPVICKFVRRLAKASVMETRQSASQVNPSNIGLSADSVLDRVRIFDHLTPKKQHLLFEAKRFKEQNQYRFCWAKNSTIYLRKSEGSRPIKITDFGSLQRLVSDT